MDTKTYSGIYTISLKWLCVLHTLLVFQATSAASNNTLVNTNTTAFDGAHSLVGASVATSNLSGLGYTSVPLYSVSLNTSNSVDGRFGLIKSSPEPFNIATNPPVLANIEAAGLTHTENALPIAVSTTITVTDIDNANLNKATIAISANYGNGQDVLRFTNQNGINGNWDSNTGVLTLSGSSSLANYRTALRSIIYHQTTNYNFSALVRTITFSVNDGALNSNTVSRTITPVAKSLVNFNYAEGLQKSLYFLEIQRSGALPAVRGKNAGQNRVEWRGNSLMNDGSDANIDLTGGLYDAGDTYKVAGTLAYTTTCLAWSGIEYSSVYSATNQRPFLLDNLKFINDYLLKCFVNDQPGSYRFYTQVTDQTFAHNHWAAPEVLDLMFAPGANKSYYIDVNCRGADIAGHVAASFASSSIVFRNAGGATNIAYANLLLNKARSMYAFGDINPSDGFNGQHRNAAGNLDGANFFYRDSNYWDNMMWGAVWLHKAEISAATSGYTNAYLAEAFKYYTITPNQDDYYVHWKELSYANVAPAAFTLLSKDATDAAQITIYKRKAEAWLDWWTTGYWDKIKYSAGGLATKSAFWGSLRLSTNQAFVAGIYSDGMADGNGVDGPTNVRANPSISGNINRKDIYDKFAQNQIRYVLGDNPYGRSYVIGMGVNSFNAPRHRANYGPWAGFEHFITGKPQFNLTTPRHVLFGALLGGPKDTDANSNPLDNFDISVNHVNNPSTNEVALD